jgi:hypothetical protein
LVEASPTSFVDGKSSHRGHREHRGRFGWEINDEEFGLKSKYPSSLILHHSIVALCALCDLCGF